MEAITRKRRSARGNDPRGEFVGTKRDLLALDILQDYDVLTSTDWRKLFPSPQYHEAIVTKLKNERYIGIPEEATRLTGWRKRPIPYKLLQPGIDLLKAHSLWRGHRLDSDQYSHKRLVSAAKASFAIAAAEISELAILTEADIIGRQDCPEATRKEERPSEISLGTSVVKPDHPIFGLSYTAPNGKKAFMFFHGFEADRGTEAGKRKDANKRKTLTTMARNYRAYYERDIAFRRYGIKRMMLLFVTIGETRARNFLEIWRTECVDHRLWPNMLAIWIPDPANLSPMPAVGSALVTGTYLRYARRNGTPQIEQFNILDTLKQTAERR